MTRNELNRAVARVTGETVTEINHRGFQPHDPFDTGEEPLVIDWDALQGVDEEPANQRERTSLTPPAAPLSKVVA